MCKISEKRKVLKKSSGVRSDQSPWFGVVLEEKMHETDGVKTFYPQKMQFINTKEIWDALAEGDEINVAE